MRLSDVGESRVNGYLFVLERSLKSFLPSDVVRDAVREIESHLRERDRGGRRLAERTRGGRADSRATRAAAARRSGVFDRADHRRGGRDRPRRADGPCRRASGGQHHHRVLHGAVAVDRLPLQPLVLRARRPQADLSEQRRWSQFVRGYPVELGAHFPLGDADLRGGYWVIPIALFFGLAIFVGTQRGARRFLSWWRERRVS